MTPPSPSKVHHLVGDRCTVLDPVATAATPARSAEDLPFVIEPGAAVEWDGLRYLLKHEGRYCFTSEKGIRNVVVFREDHVTFFAALAQIHVKGARHRDLSTRERIEVMRRGRLSVMCGGITSVALLLLAELGHTARRVVTQRVDQPGGVHVLLEYLVPGTNEWVLVDIHNHAMLESRDHFLSVRDLIAAVRDGTPFTVRRLTRLGGLDYFSWGQAGSGEFSLGSELTMYDDATAHTLYADTGRRWGIYEDDGCAYFAGSAPETVAVLTATKASHRCLDLDAWSRRFYNGSS